MGGLKGPLAFYPPATVEEGRQKGERMNDTGNTSKKQPPPGISLRDHFAGLAMLGEMITSFSDATPEAAEMFREAAHEWGHEPLEHLAFNAYRIADAMLAARERGDG